MARSAKSSGDAVAILWRRLYKGKPARQRALENVRRNEEIARTLYNLRTQAGLTQAQLAQRVGTTASVICRLEDADYEGHSLAMLSRVAAVLDQCIEIRLVPAKRSA